MEIRSSKLCLALVIGLAGCTKAEQRSTQYFAAHLDEARQIDAQCRAGSARSEECANAGAAVQEANGKARFRKFLGH